MPDSERRGPIPSNPLSDDLVLFDMYMSALDAVVGDSEIRDGLAEFGLSPHALRGTMVAGADQVLRTAPREFAAYEAARDGEAGLMNTAARSHLPPPEAAGRMLGLLIPQSIGEPMRVMRWLSVGSAAVGLLFIVAGVASIRVWPGTEPLVWAGTVMLVLAALVYGSHLLITTRAGEGFWLLRGDSVAENPDLTDARNRLMAAITHEELMAQARTFINTRRRAQFSHAYSVADISGLSETYDSTYQVATRTAADLEGLLERLDGASIGVAGPRGSGKSTLIRGYCDHAGLGRASITGGLLNGASRHPVAGGDLRCMVSAPVNYAARDFVLHLFALFCRAVIDRHETDRRRASEAASAASLEEALWAARDLTSDVFRYGIRYALPAVVLLRWQRPIAAFFRVPANWAYYAGLAIAVFGILRLAGAPGRVARRTRARAPRDNLAALTVTAREHLARVRYLQTHTSGWSGTLTLPSGGGQYSHSSARAEQPLSYPEIVGEFRGFAAAMAAHLHGKGDRIFIGIDELDKIGAPDQAEQFLNEIKGIFGIPYVYFMVSVSDDALTSFERRGLPLRDAFDSSFDEIIHVEQLSYAESRRLLYRRVIGLTEPYVALCHCLAGGLARDLIRAARQIIRVGETITGISGPPTLSEVCAGVVREELRRKTRAVAHVASSTAPGTAQNLHDSLQSVIRYLAPGAPPMKVVAIASQLAPGEPAPVTALRVDFAAYAYYCATLQEVFTDDLDTEQMIKATTTAVGPGSFDALAEARYAFTLDTQLAWRSITQFRQAWFLEIRDPISG